MNKLSKKYCYTLYSLGFQLYGVQGLIWRPVFYYSLSTQQLLNPIKQTCYFEVTSQKFGSYDVTFESGETAGWAGRNVET